MLQGIKWQWTPTDVVALYGALVATLALLISTVVGVLQFLSYRRDRSRLRVSFKCNWETVNDPVHEGMKLTVVEAVNVGRRPLTVKGVGLHYLRGGGAFFTDVVPRLPCELTEGKMVTALVDETDLKFENIAEFAAWDSFDRVFRAPYAAIWRRAFWAAARRFIPKKKE